MFQPLPLRFFITSMTSAKNVLFSALLISLMTGCATQEPDTRHVTKGRILEVQTPTAAGFQARRTATGYSGILPLPVDTPKATRSHLYTIRTSDGKVIRATGEGQMLIGTCVELRHMTDLSTITSEHNYISGELLPSQGCSSE